METSIAAQVFEALGWHARGLEDKLQVHTAIELIAMKNVTNYTLASFNSYIRETMSKTNGSHVRFMEKYMKNYSRNYDGGIADFDMKKEYIERMFQDITTQELVNAGLTMGEYGMLINPLAFIEFSRCKGVRHRFGLVVEVPEQSTFTLTPVNFIGRREFWRNGRKEHFSLDRFESADAMAKDIVGYAQEAEELQYLLCSLRENREAKKRQMNRT